MTPSGMSLPPVRLIPSALALVAVALLAAGCSSAPAAPAPTSTGGAEASPTAPSDPEMGDVGATWLDDGRMIGIVTWGSSSADCTPTASDVTADGQTIRVILTDQSDGTGACTADFTARAIAVPVPEGVDVTKEVDVDIVYGEIKADADLDGLAAAPQGQGDQAPSAGWLDDQNVVLLTWGSSTCLPVVEDITASDSGAKVAFATTDGACTRDLVPRATVLSMPAPRTGDAPFTLTLTGDHLDGTVQVLG